MIHITTINQDEIVVSFPKSRVFSRKLGNALLLKLKSYFEIHESITIDLDGIESIASEGYNSFSEINTQANAHNCRIIFASTSDKLREIIDSFSLTSES